MNRGSDVSDKLFCINCGDECNAIDDPDSYSGANRVSDCCSDGTTTVNLSKWTILQHPSMNYGVNFYRNPYRPSNHADSYQDAIRQIIEIESVNEQGE